MDTKHSSECHTECAHNLHAPNIRKVTSVSFLAELARDFTSEDLSAPQIVYQAFDELLSNHTGILYDFNGQPIDIEATYQDGDDILQYAFGGDWGRGMRRILERAERPFRNQMKATPKLLMRILLLHYAREIRNCRLSGKCSHSAKLAE